MTNKVKFLNRRKVLFLVLLAALLRIVYIFTLEEQWYYFDTAHYDQAACAIVEGEGFGDLDRNVKVPVFEG